MLWDNVRAVAAGNVCRSKQSESLCSTMSSDKTESEAATLGPVLINGIDGAGRESPGVGVSGNKPMVNGDLREDEGDFVAVKSAVDGIKNSAQEDVAVKVRERERGTCVAN